MSCAGGALGAAETGGAAGTCEFDFGGAGGADGRAAGVDADFLPTPSKMSRSISSASELQIGQRVIGFRLPFTLLTRSSSVQKSRRADLTQILEICALNAKGFF
jgi:hypothetical protein